MADIVKTLAEDAVDMAAVEQAVEKTTEEGGDVIEIDASFSEVKDNGGNISLKTWPVALRNAESPSEAVEQYGPNT